MMSGQRKISIGSFNYYIGCAMLGVVLAHTIGLFPEESLPIFVRAVFEVITYIGVAGFAVISGYKLKLPDNLKRYVFRTVSKFIKLYSAFGIVTVIMFGIIHFLCFHYLKGSLTETFLMAVGFLFAVYPSIPIGDHMIYSCGPMYFFVAFMMAELISVVVLLKVKKHVEIVFISLMLIGSALSTLLPGMPFALSYVMLFTGCIYAGYDLKRKSFLEKGIDFKSSVILIVLSVVIHFFGKLSFVKTFESFFTMSAGVLAGLVLINLCFNLAENKNKFNSIIKEIGRFSFLVVGAHTIEYFAIPWYLVVDKTQGLHVEISLITIYVVRLALIYIIVKCSLFLTKKKKKFLNA